MQFSESWLRTFCNPNLSTQQLADTLTMAGLEVEELKSVAPPFSGVVVGEILEVVQHPNADRLRVCTVNVGSKTPLDIVCGAPNARVGLRVPCALVGASLPPGADGKPFLIKLGKLRGVESEGMLCSAQELQISQDQAGLLELAADAPLGQCIRAHLNLDDTLFTLKLTPNLAHCLSVYGIAREVSALTGAPLLPNTFPTISHTIADVLPVKISATDLCGRFSGRVIRNVNTKATTPSWMVERLARCGQRSVTALVDISNYMMFELGRPTHIFDLDKIVGGLDVRWGRTGESLKLLNGNTVTLDETVGVITDDRQVESLAGIMGGDASSVSDDTCNIYVEAAFWWPKAIAGRSRRFNFSTDAGHRFERGVDSQLTVEHLERLSQLIIDICGTPDTQCGPMDDHEAHPYVPKTVDLRPARASKVIGMQLTEAQCVDALTRLGLPTNVNNGIISVTPPSYRFDLEIEEDLIEEVARMVGYDNLPHTPPVAPTASKLRREATRSAFSVRRSLAALGYQETINFSFVDESWEHGLSGNPTPIKLLNPIASHMSVMRSSLLGSLLQVLKFNQARKQSRVRIFELGRVFLRNPSIQDTDTTVAGFHQPMRVAGLASGSVDTLQWSRKEQPADFFDIKGDVEALLAPIKARFTPANHPSMHPGRCAEVWIENLSIGFVGELHPRWKQVFELTLAPVVFELDLAAVLQRVVPNFQPVAKFQPVQRDIAVVVSDDVTHSDLMAAIHTAPTADLLRDAQLFDVYRPKLSTNNDMPQPGASERSLAVRITLNSDQSTLSDAQIDDAMKSIVTHLESTVGARQRI